MPFDPAWIVTNPPFTDGMAERFTLRAIACAPAVAMFVRSQWAVEGGERYETIFRPHPPTLCAFFSERVNLAKGRWDPDGSTATAYAWLVWINGRAPMPPLWISTGPAATPHQAGRSRAVCCLVPAGSRAPRPSWRGHGCAPPRRCYVR